MQVTLFHGIFSAEPSTSVTEGAMPVIVHNMVAITQTVKFQGKISLIQSELSKLKTIGLAAVTVDSTIPATAGQCKWLVTFENNALVNVGFPSVGAHGCHFCASCDCITATQQNGQFLNS
eukprot:9842126-Ditylum_brightwellii.AAC.1